MSNDITQDPLEGKGEEMIPEKGLPFDDIDETPLEDIPPEERIPDFEEEEIAFDDEQPLLMEVEESIVSEEASVEETSSEEAASFVLSDEEAEALIGDISETFGTEASPWSLSEEEAEAIVGDAGEVFAPSEAFVDDTSMDEELPTPTDEALVSDEFDQPPDEFADEGMGTFREELPIDSEHVHEPYVAEVISHTPEPVAPPKVHTHDDIVHSGQQAEQTMVDILISDDDMKALWRRIDKAQQDVNRYITTLYIARPMLDQIQAARNELMAGKANFEDAERHINEVDYRVQLSRNLDVWGKQYIRWLFIYLAAFFAALVIVLFVWLGDAAFAKTADITTSVMVYLGGSMVWGGIGGIIGALLPLIKHFSKDQDFAKRHAWWYLTSPPTGIAMGAIVFLFMSAGLLSISGGDINSPVVIYILSGLAGYQHNVFTDLVKRMLKVLQIEEKKDTDTPKSDDKPEEEK